MTRAIAARVVVVWPTLVVLVAVLLPTPSRAAAPLHHDLTVMLDPATRHLRVSDRIRVDAGREVVFRLAARFRLERLLLDGRTLAPEQAPGAAQRVWHWRARAPADRAVILEARFDGALDALDEALDHRQVLGLARPLAGPQGAFLPAGTGWYPHSEDDLVTYRMKVSVPAGFRAVTSGAVLAEATTASGAEAVFEMRDPLPGIDLLAGPYVVSERIVHLAQHRDVRLRTYFHEELGQLAQPYLDSAAAYLARYDNAIGPYAFAAYSIVSSALPTGFGMPGIAYLGKQVLRLPFIRTTSLGHEVLHDWWGNGVYPDYARGNWSEGLTTFLADYAFKEDQGEAQARAMRLAWLRDFAAVRPEQDRPLSAFISRRHGADQALGYNKTAFVFFMLRDLIGAERFDAGLRRFWAHYRFRSASWEELRQAFEAASGRELQSFFAQWVSRAGAPELAIGSARGASAAGRYRLTVELRQRQPPYRMNVPVRAYLENGASHDAQIDISAAHARSVLELPARALSVSIDPDVRIFRRLERQEIAPILREIMLDRRVALATLGNDTPTRTAANELARALLEHSPSSWEGGSLDAGPPLLIIGLHQDVADFLARHALPEVPGELKARGSAFAYVQRSRGGMAYAVVSARDSASLGALTRSLPHLGAQSFVAFEGARSIERGVWPAQPLRYPVSND